MEVIPEQILTYLPFSEEPISQWDERSELLNFLCDLFDKSAMALYADGARIPVSYRSYGKTVFDTGRSAFQFWIQNFTERAQGSSYGLSEADKALIPDFYKEPLFGKVAKYKIALDAVIEEMLSEGAFFSLVHVLEARDEIECSLLLASSRYYKQALQVLRNLIEGATLTIHFCENPKAFSEWKASNYKIPPLRGYHKKAILHNLVMSHVMPKDLADKLGQLYGELNGSIHGNAEQLINKGVFDGNWKGDIYKPAEYVKWCSYFCRSTDLTIRLLRINVEQWERIRPKNKVICDVCHTDDLDCEGSWFGGELSLNYHCRKCNSSFSRAADYK